MAKLQEVFVAGGLPTVTYVPRTEHKLEDALRDYLFQRHKILSVSGPTKSGKTVLVRRLLPKGKAFWISGGQAATADAFWQSVLGHLGGHTTVAISSSAESAQQSAQKYTAGVRPGGIGAEAQTSTKDISSSQQTRQRSRTVNPAIAALTGLVSAGIPLVIDDFHYIDKTIQKEIIRSLKEPIFEGLPVILISVPHRAFDAVRVEKEMTGRVSHLQIPAWTTAELTEIPLVGFKALNASCGSEITEMLQRQAFGSPHLMQDFCLELGRINQLWEAAEDLRLVHTPQGWDTFFRDRAADTSKSAFERLAKGPRQRTDRMPRILINDKTCDIYVAILLAIAHTGPKISLTYEDIRAGLKAVLQDELPQSNEVTRILEKMSEIAQKEIEGEPVVDWDKEYSTLHISDPFFAYYLRWGVEPPLKLEKESALLLS